MILSQIIEKKKESIEQAKNKLPQETLIERMDKLPLRRSFKQAIKRHHDISLIAEVKRSSPSGGLLREKFDPVEIAQTYQANGANAISVLTEEAFFEGKLSYIEAVKGAARLPALRKDFILDEYQVYESKLAGADALLLIAEILSEEELRTLLGITAQIGLDALVEVHNDEDLKKALNVGSEIIGINNRNLHTFKVDLNITPRLIRLIPKHKIIVAESGIKSYEDVMFLKSLGIDAILVGEVFMRSPDIGRTVRELMGRT